MWSIGSGVLGKRKRKIGEKPEKEKYGSRLVWELGEKKKEKWKRRDGEMGGAMSQGREKKRNRMGKKKKTKWEKNKK